MHDDDDETDLELQPDPGPRPAEADIRSACLAALEQLRPVVERDGGRLSLAGIQGDRVFIRLEGACTSCGLAGQTLGGVRRELVRRLGWPVRVVPATS